MSPLEALVLYCPKSFGVWWKCPFSTLGCPGQCPLLLSAPVLSLIVIYCPVLALCYSSLSFIPFIIHYYSLLSPCCPLLSFDCPFDIHIVLNCPSYTRFALDCPIFSLIALIVCPLSYSILSIVQLTQLTFIPLSHS